MSGRRKHCDVFALFHLTQRESATSVRWYRILVVLRFLPSLLFWSPIDRSSKVLQTDSARFSYLTPFHADWRPRLENSPVGDHVEAQVLGDRVPEVDNLSSH